MNLPGFTAETSLGRRMEFYSLEHLDAQENSSVNSQITPQQLGLPIYGRWCGPGHGGRALNDPPPIDAVDEACMMHDLCYDNRGFFDCGCDRELILNMPGAILRTPTVLGQNAGTAVMNYFMQSPCSCRHRVCVRIPLVGRRCRRVTLPGFGGVGTC